MRRPLVHHGGGLATGGDPSAAELLVHALERAASEPADRLTHGFHTWTARLHPAIAQTLIPELCRPDGAVLDPFVGGGTVVLEAMLAGRASVGADLNPLSPLVASVKCRLTDARARASLRLLASEVAERSTARVVARTKIDVPVAKAVAASYEGHVLKELGGLREELFALPEGPDRDALLVAFSSNLVKLSRLRADSAERFVEKRLRKGLATELFERKVAELVARLEALAGEAPRGAQPPRLLVAEVETLSSRLPKGARFALALSSPPYGGTYDYVVHHRLRLAFLGLPVATFAARELGSRRRSDQPGALARFDEETTGYLKAIADRLEPGGHLALFVGDGLVEGRHVPAVEHLAARAAPLGYEPVAFASEERETGRSESLVLLRYAPTTVRPSRSGGRPSAGGRRAGSGGSRRA